MHAAQGARAVVIGQVALHEPLAQPVLGEIAAAKGPGEQPPIVFVGLDVDDEGAGQGRFAEQHQNTSTRGIGTTNFPPHSRMAAICSAISSLRFHGRMSR